APARLVALSRTSAFAPDTGRQVYERIIDARIKASMKAQEQNVRLSPEALDQVSRQKASEELKGVDLDKAPMAEDVDWARVLEYAGRYDDAVKLVDRLLATN